MLTAACSLKVSQWTLTEAPHHVSASLWGAINNICQSHHEVIINKNVNTSRHFGCSASIIRRTKTRKPRSYFTRGLLSHIIYRKRRWLCIFWEGGDNSHKTDFSECWLGIEYFPAEMQISQCKKFSFYGSKPIFTNFRTTGECISQWRQFFGHLSSTVTTTCLTQTDCQTLYQVERLLVVAALSSQIRH